MLKKLGFVKLSKDTRPYMSQGMKDFTAGSIAGATSATVVFPLDTLTTRAQAKHVLNHVETSGKTTSGLKKYTSLYKGLPWKVLKGAPGAAVTLATYGVARRKLGDMFTSRKPQN